MLAHKPATAKPTKTQTVGVEHGQAVCAPVSCARQTSHSVVCMVQPGIFFLFFLIFFSHSMAWWPGTTLASRDNHVTL